MLAAKALRKTHFFLLSSQRKQNGSAARGSPCQWSGPSQDASECTRGAGAWLLTGQCRLSILSHASGNVRNPQTLEVSAAGLRKGRSRDRGIPKLFSSVRFSRLSRVQLLSFREEYSGWL